MQPTYDDPYNSDSPNLTPETPPLEKVIVDAIMAKLQTTRVWLPCKVVKVSGNQKVDIQPLIQQLYKSGTLVTLPVIQNVMVQMLQGQSYFLRFPVTVGDTGIALFCDRSLDNWSVSGGMVDPQDIRIHDYADPIFIPGLVPFSGQTQEGTTDIVLNYSGNIFRFKADGTVLFNNGTGMIQMMPNGEILLNSGSGMIKIESGGNIDLGGTASPFVLGDVLQTYEDSLLLDMTTFATAVQTFATACAASVTDPVLAAAAPALAAAAGALMTQLTALKLQYVDTPTTNFLSQKVFGVRS